MDSIMKLTLLGLLLAASLPASAEILSSHCPLGCPTSPETNDLVFHHIYALSNNPTTKFADWVAYEVSPENYGVTPGRNWKSDPLIDDDETLEESDYKGVYSSELEADKGHQVPLAAFAGNQYWYEVNYLSNITPQDKHLNEGPWEELESAVREAATYTEPLYVISGPVYERKMANMPNADETHTVPSGYYKIVYNSKETMAFFMDQNSGRKDNYCSKITTVESVQTKVSYQLPALKSGSTDLRDRLGCH